MTTNPFSNEEQYEGEIAVDESGLEAEQLTEYGEDDIPNSGEDTDTEFASDLDAAVETDPDVDTPAEDDEVEEVPSGTAAAPADPKAEKPKKESSRPAVPEGYVSPVQFAKILTEHLRANGKLDENQEVRPQVVYSYIKNNGPDSKNPFPAKKGEDVGAPGRSVVLKAQEGLDWWDAKDERVAKGKQDRAAKAAAKAEKTEQVKETEGSEDAGPVTEAE